MNKFTELVAIIYKIVFPAAVLLGMFLIIKAGYVLMTSQGDPRKTQNGKEDLTSAIIGLIFIITSVALLRILMGMLGAS